MEKHFLVTCSRKSVLQIFVVPIVGIIFFLTACNSPAPVPPEDDLFGFKKLDLYKDLEDGILKYDTLNENGTYSLGQKLPVLDSLLGVAISRKDDFNISNIQRRRGICWIDLGVQDSALNSFLISLDKARVVENKYMIANGYYYLSKLYLHFTYPEKAILYLGEFMKVAKAINRIDLFVEGNIHYTKAYMQMGKWNEALSAVRFVVKNIYRAPENTRIYYSDSLLHHLDLVKCTDKVMPDSVVIEMRKLLAKVAFDPQVKVKSQVYSYAALWHAKNNNGNSNFYVDSALKYFDSTLNFETKATVVSNIHDYYAEIGKTEKAYQFAMLEKDIQSQLYSKEKLVAVTGVNETYNKLTNNTIVLLNEQAVKRRNYLFFSLIFLFLVILLSILVILNTRQKKQIVEINLQNKNREVEDLIQKQALATVGVMIEGQEKERQRIAQELHDRLGGLLNISRLTLEGINYKEEEGNEEKIKEAASMLSEAADEVRRISHDLHGGAVMRFGLKNALESLGKVIVNANSMNVVIHSASMPVNLPNELEIDIYRICQELLTNSLKYSSASEIHIQVLDNDDGLVSLSYEDNGIGFDKNDIKLKGGIGFENIFNRVKKYYGNANIESKPGAGFGFFAHFEPQLTRKL